MRGYIPIIKSKEYRNALIEMAKRITMAAKKAPNEATIESRFDCELFAFFREQFEPFGFEYNPIKEKSIATCRHIAKGSKGRADTAISTLVMEFKQPSALSNQEQRRKAIEQIKGHLEGISDTDNHEMYEGYITDGIKGCFITYINGKAKEEKFTNVDEFALDRIIQNILSLKLIAFNANNLVESFCNPPENNGIAFELVEKLFDILRNKICEKTEMLFLEWKELFNLAHDDISKQQAIIDRKKSLEKLLNTELNDKDEEYLALFALQSAYAIIIKIIAYKLVSQIRFKDTLISFETAMEMDSDSMQALFVRLENGGVFSDYNMRNLLEGDFFSWYCNEKQ